MDIIKRESLPEMKYSLVWLNTRRQISELKDTARETIQTEAQRTNVKKTNRALVSHRAITSMGIKFNKEKERASKKEKNDEENNTYFFTFRKNSKYRHSPISTNSPKEKNK